MSNKFNFTEASIKALPPASNGRATYYDTKIPGLVLRVTPNGIKTFSFMKWVKATGSPQRITIGKYPHIDVEEARKQAFELNSQVAQGKNPSADRQTKKNELTVGELYKEFKERHSKHHKLSFMSDEEIFKNKIEGTALCKKKISDVTRQDIANHHTNIGKTQPVRANRTLSLLCTMFNKGIEWGLCAQNPCHGVKKYKEIPRKRYLTQAEISPFFEALTKLPNEIMKDFFFIKLFVGNRRSKVQAMRESELDLENGIWQIEVTKNKLSHTVPLTQIVVDRLKRRLKRNKVLGYSKKGSKTRGWLFPSPNSASGHIEEPKRAWKNLTDAAGIDDLRIHDLRHSMGSWLNATGADIVLIKNMLGHKDISSSQVYIHTQIGVVKKAAEKAQEAILSHIKK